MATIGNKRNIMLDTTLKAPSKENSSKSNLTIKEGDIFKKPDEPIELEVAEKPKNEPITITETPKLIPPETKKKGRPKMTEERREQLKKERSERLVAGRAKSLENRRQKALQKKIAEGRSAEQKIATRAQTLVEEQPIQQMREEPQAPPPPQQQLPPGFAGSSVPMKKLVEQQQFDYNKIIDGVWGKMSNYNQGIDDQALLNFQDKIRKEEQEKAKMALQGEYEKINKVRSQMNQMNNSVSLLQGRANNSRTNHRVFGRKPRVLPQAPNPFDVCFN